jgi:hypothetical protein
VSVPEAVVTSANTRWIKIDADVLRRRLDDDEPIIRNVVLVRLKYDYWVGTNELVGRYNLEFIWGALEQDGPPSRLIKVANIFWQ